jgi:CPA2 family monovalent cation:H+ antiporter-2
MFTIGLEFSFKKLNQFKRLFFTVGLFQVLVTVTITALLFYVFIDPHWPKALFTGFLVSLSSTAAILKLLHDGRDFQTSYGQYTVSVLLFQDLAVIPMLLVLPLLGAQSIQTDGSWLSFFQLIATGTALISGIFLASRFVIPWVLDRVVRTRSRELFFFCVLFICVGSAYVMHEIGLSVSLGALIAGMLVSESPYGKQATSDFAPLQDNFLGIFFVSIGMLIDFDFVLANIPSVLGFSVGLILLKAFIVFGVAWVFGAPRVVSIITAMLLSQVGEFSFLILEQGASLNLFSETYRQYFVAAAILSLSTTPFLYLLAPKIGAPLGISAWIPDRLLDLTANLRSDWLESDWKRKSKKRALQKDKESPKKAEEAPVKNPLNQGHVIIVGFGIAGQNIARSFRSFGIPYKIIEWNNSTVRRYEKHEPISFGDASRAEVLEQAGIDTAKLMVVAISGTPLTQAVLRTVKRLRPSLHVILRLQYLRELEGVQRRDEVEIVVGEFETTLEIIGRALNLFEVDSKEIYGLLKDTKAAMDPKKSKQNGLLLKKFEIPKQEIISHIHSLELDGESWARKQSLSDLKLRQSTGVSIVAVFREGMGVTYPRSDFELEVGDVIYILGSNEQAELATHYLNNKAQGSSEVSETS